MRPMLRLLAASLLWVSTLAGAAVEIAWEELIPLELRGQQAMPLPVHGISALGELSEEEFGDPALQTEPAAPVVAEMEGRHVRLPGYIVPLGITDTMEVQEFLLVPYFGACIHVPPPPSNQIVHVRSTSGIKLADLYQPFWITGVVQVEHTESELANAGYRIEAASVEPYVY
ncbi:DUF3299 domain-containing protein [Halopseudomonas pertucinogena]|uniref:DUF3299 domain-containing protein n=1 Tax=Halopseudomonas pertucinogena TaxID=86175 RepID=A0ABQ2CSY0_9GAMM|nr:hypothetical protein GCM10009083_27820 [Halopseudomonas pertucinogena]